MPPEIKQIKEILCDKMLLSHNNNTIQLKEKGTQATLTRICLANVSNEYLSLKPDNAKISIFHSGYGNKQCDYIVMSQSGTEKYALFVDLKSSVKEKSAYQGCPSVMKGEYEDYVTQFRSSSCLLDFLHSVLCNFCGVTALNNEYERRYVVLHNKNIGEISKPVPFTRPVPNDSPESAYIRKVNNDDSIPFESLIR